MNKTHTVAIIGLGIMGRRMLSNMRLHPLFEPVALWDPSEESCRKARQEAPEVPIVASAEAALAAADAIYLACPPLPRKAYALATAAAGKAMFLEKPLGIDIAASRDLVMQLEQAGVPTAVNFTQAAGAALAEMQRAINANETGPIVGIDIIVNYAAWPRVWQVEADWLRFRAEGGYTREVISHFVFFSERLLGQTEVVWARPSYPTTTESAQPQALTPLCETDVAARLETADGIPINIFGSVGGAQPDRQEVTVRCTQRSYRILEFYQLWCSEGEAFNEILERPADPRRETLQRQLSELDKCIRGETHLLATAQEALSVQEKIESILNITRGQNA